MLDTLRSGCDRNGDNTNNDTKMSARNPHASASVMLSQTCKKSRMIIYIGGVHGTSGFARPFFRTRRRKPQDFRCIKLSRTLMHNRCAQRRARMGPVVDCGLQIPCRA